MHCIWCDSEATTYLISDRDSHNSVDTACDEHAEEHEHLYRRAVPMRRPVVDLRERAPEVVDLTAGLPVAAEAADAVRERTTP
jgi:hypothetical protein